MPQQTGNFDEFQEKLFQKILRKGRAIIEADDVGTIPGLIQEIPIPNTSRKWISKDPCLPMD